MQSLNFFWNVIMFLRCGEPELSSTGWLTTGGRLTWEVLKCRLTSSRVNKKCSLDVYLYIDVYLVNNVDLQPEVVLEVCQNNSNQMIFDQTFFRPWFFSVVWVVVLCRIPWQGCLNASPTRFSAKRGKHGNKKSLKLTKPGQFKVKWQQKRTLESKGKTRLTYNCAHLRLNNKKNKDELF